MIPEVITQHIFDYCRRNAGVRVDIHKENNPYPWYGLFFDIDGKAKVSEADFTLITYINNHLKYAREPISVRIDGKDLKEIVPLALPLLTPDNIDITNI